jgi:hypothetical protein
MKLTEKDKAFLDNLRRLMDSKDLWVELRAGNPSYMVLRGTYGQAVHRAFRMTRQGVRWRFQRLFNDVYVSAFETILFIEKSFGTGLRDHAIRISRERHQLRQKVGADAYQSANTLQARQEPSRPQTGQQGPDGPQGG